MKALDAARYTWNARLLGPVALRLNRLMAERKPPRPSPSLAPPLQISPRTKELIFRHYLEGRYAEGARKVAWVTSGAPVELLRALDFYVLYPENHAAVCATARQAVSLCQVAEDTGYARDLCSYARTDLGSVLSGRTPAGKLPRPDVLVACTNICQTVLFWYKALARHFNAPLVLVDTPFVYTEAGEHAIRYVQAQVEESVPMLEKIAGRRLDLARLRQVVRLSRDATWLWMQILERAACHPAPISVFDQFIHMAPIVEMRGFASTVDFYAALLKEVDRRVKDGVGAVKDEKKRLLWDNLPVWFRLRWLGEHLGAHGAALIASTYTNAWGELAAFIDPEQPFESAARTYLHPILNRGTGHKLATMRSMAANYQLDGAILHSDRSCKPYSIGQIDQRERLARESSLPALLLEADHSDERSFSEENAAARIEAFMELLGV